MKTALSLNTALLWRTFKFERGAVKVEHNAASWWGYNIDYVDYGPEQAVIVPYSEVSLEESQANKGILNSVIAYAEAAKESGEYDNAIESVQKSFDAALENAKTVAGNAAATQEEVDAAVTSVQEAMKGLVAVEKPSTETPDNNKADSTQTGQESTTTKANAAKTGDVAPIAGVMALVLAGAAVVTLKRKNNTFFI